MSDLASLDEFIASLPQDEQDMIEAMRNDWHQERITHALAGSPMGAAVWAARQKIAAAGLPMKPAAELVRELRA